MQDYHILPVRIDKKLFKELRHLAFQKGVPMADIIRIGIKIVLDRDKKSLTWKDIAI